MAIKLPNHFHGRIRPDNSRNIYALFAFPVRKSIRQVISYTKLPFKYLFSCFAGETGIMKSCVQECIKGRFLRTWGAKPHKRSNKNMLAI